MLDELQNGDLAKINLSGASAAAASFCNLLTCSNTVFYHLHFSGALATEKLNSIAGIGFSNQNRYIGGRGSYQRNIEPYEKRSMLYHRPRAGCWQPSKLTLGARNSCMAFPYSRQYPIQTAEGNC